GLRSEETKAGSVVPLGVRLRSACDTPAFEAWSIIALALIAHAPALFGGYLWLDHAQIERGAAVLPPGRWLEGFSRGFAGTGYYRPLVTLSLSLEAAVSGGPLLHHALNLALHAAAALALARAGAALGLTRAARTLGAWLFAVHPLGSIVASAIAFRSESL